MTLFQMNFIITYAKGTNEYDALDTVGMVTGSLWCPINNLCVLFERYYSFVLDCGAFMQNSVKRPLPGLKETSPDHQSDKKTNTNA